MRHDEAAALDRFDRYLDAVVRGEPLTGIDLDAALRATDAHLRALDGPLVPDRAFVQRLRADLLRPGSIPTAPAISSRLRPRLRAHPTDAPTRTATPPARPARWQPIAGWVAFAALLLVTVAVGSFALRPGSDDARQSIGGPDTPGVTHDVIAQADVSDMRTDYPITYTGIGRFTLDPGESMTSGPDSTYGDGLYLFLVESGPIALIADGPTELSTGGDGASNPVAVGTEVILDAGDRGVVWQGTAAVWRNPGPGKATVLHAAVGEAVSTLNYFEATDLVRSLDSLPALPATFALHRLTFAPGARLPVADLQGLVMLGVDAGSLDVPLTTGAGTPVRVRDFDVGDGFLAKDWPVAPDDEFRNSGSEPAVVFALTAEPLTAPAAADDLLVRAAVSTLPAGAHTWMGFERITIPPGATVQFGPARHDGDGPLLFVVETGPIAFRADGPAVLIRNGTAVGDATVVVPDADVPLATGDRGFAPTGITAQWHNTGSVAATILDVSLSSSGSGRAPTGSLHRSLFNRQNAAWPALPAVFSLHRLSLEPGASLPVAALPPVAMLYVDAGKIEVPLEIGGTTPAWTRGFAAGDGMSAADWTIAADGQFRNAGAERAVVFVLAIEPPADPGGTPTP